MNVEVGMIIAPIRARRIIAEVGGSAGRSQAVRHNFRRWRSARLQDVIGDLTEYIYPPSRLSDGRYSGCIQGLDSGTDMRGVGEFNISFTYAFYPNKCADTPADLQDYYMHP